MQKILSMWHKGAHCAFNCLNRTTETGERRKRGEKDVRTNQKNEEKHKKNIT